MVSFSLVLQPVIEQIKKEVLDLLLNAWYLDDGTLCGAADNMKAPLAIVEQD